MIKMCDLPRYADADMEEIKNEKRPTRFSIRVTYGAKAAVSWIY